MGACIDTAHSFDAGYAIHTAAGLNAAVKQLDATIGLRKVRVIHANDSKTAFGSHADRHEHIGKGRSAPRLLRASCGIPSSKNIPFICETPVDQAGRRRSQSADDAKAWQGWSQW